MIDSHQHKGRLGRCLLGVVIVAPMLMLFSACNAGPETAGADSPSASATDEAEREKEKGIRLSLESRLLLLDEETASAVLTEVWTADRVEVAPPEGKEEPIEAYLLNDVQVDLLVRAAQASGTAAHLKATRLTVRAGQPSMGGAIYEEKYIKAYESVKDEPEPIFGTFRRGFTFRGRGEVTDDRRHVDLRFRSELTTATGPKEQHEPSSDDSPDEQEFVERPQKARWEAAGRTTIPDGATLLLIGDEIEGVVNLKDEQIAEDDPRFDQQRRILLLVKPSIIMHQTAQASTNDDGSTVTE